MMRSSADGQQAVAYCHCVTHLDVDGTDGAGLEGADFGFHLHRFEDDHQLPFLDGLAWLHQHLEDIAGQRRRLRLAATRCDRIWRSSSVHGATDGLDTLDIATFAHLHDEGFAIDLDGIDLGLASLTGGSFLTGRRRLEGRRVAAVFQKLQTDLREQRVGQYVVDLVSGKLDTLLLGDALEFGGQLGISASSRSAGRQVIASAPSSTRACNSALKGAGAAPYSPLSTPAVSLVIDL